MADVEQIIEELRAQLQVADTDKITAALRSLRSRLDIPNTRDRDVIKHRDEMELWCKAATAELAARSNLI